MDSAAKRLGRPPKPPGEKQRGVRVFLSDSERAALDAARGQRPMSEWIRETCLEAARGTR